jgi:hypothetical protein
VLKYRGMSLLHTGFCVWFYVSLFSQPCKRHKNKSYLPAARGFDIPPLAALTRPFLFAYLLGVAVFTHTPRYEIFAEKNECAKSRCGKARVFKQQPKKRRGSAALFILGDIYFGKRITIWTYLSVNSKDT